MPSRRFVEELTEPVPRRHRKDPAHGGARIEPVLFAHGAKDRAFRFTNSRTLVAGLPRIASTSWVRRS